MAATVSNSTPASASTSANVGATEADGTGPNGASHGGGGFRAWLPLIVSLIAMPLLAYLTTRFLLVPHLNKAIRPGTAAVAEPGGSEAGELAHGEAGVASGEKINYPFGKVLVNVAGSLGTRYLLASLTLVGTGSDFRHQIEAHRDQLLDLASGALGAKTIADLEKPGARNLLRSELISVFNTALGSGAVQEIYFTEFAIQ